MNTLKSKLKLNEFLKDESAQGMTEYILLIVVVVGLAYAFKDKIKAIIGGKMGQIDGEMQGFSVDKSGF